MNRDNFSSPQKIPKVSLPFHTLLHSVLSTQLLLVLKKGRFPLVVVTSKQIDMDSQFEKTDFSRRDILKWRYQVEEETSLTFRSTWLKEQVGRFLPSDSTVGQWIPPSPPIQSLAFRFGSLSGTQWIKASTFVFFNSCLLSWSCTNFCCLTSCWSS